MKMLQQLAAFWRRIWTRFSPPQRQTSFSGIVRVQFREDDQKALTSRKLVVVGTAEKSKWLRFLCPCGCGEVLALNLMKSQRPVWTIELHQDQTLTANPSVDAQKCGAHFWIRRSQIEWCD